MERLTRRLISGAAVLTQAVGVDDPVKMSAIRQCAFNRLAAYEDAEEQGLLVRPPCKVGTTVYRRYMDCDKPFKKEHCRDWKKGDSDKRSCESCPHRHPIAIPISFGYEHIPLFGKTVFLTHQEAEATLKEANRNG